MACIRTIFRFCACRCIGIARFAAVIVVFGIAVISAARVDGGRIDAKRVSVVIDAKRLTLRTREILVFFAVIAESGLIGFAVLDLIRTSILFEMCSDVFVQKGGGIAVFRMFFCALRIADV